MRLTWTIAYAIMRGVTDVMPCSCARQGRPLFVFAEGSIADDGDVYICRSV